MCAVIRQYCVKTAKRKITQKKFRHGTASTEFNNAVDGGPLLLTPMTVDASDAIAYTIGLRLKLHWYDLLCRPICRKLDFIA